jgi:hypothetical protein
LEISSAIEDRTKDASNPNLKAVLKLLIHCFTCL